MMNDANCHEEHEKIHSSVDQVRKDLEWHAAEQHAEVMPRHEIKETVTHVKTVAEKNAENVSLILDEIIGPVNRLSGERRHEEGISWQVRRMWAESQNGGSRSKLTGGQKFALGLAALDGLFQIASVMFPLWFGS